MKALMINTTRAGNGLVEQGTDAGATVYILPDNIKILSHAFSASTHHPPPQPLLTVPILLP